MATMWAKVCLPTRHRVPTQACSSRTSGSAEQIARNRSTRGSGGSVPFGIRSVIAQFDRQPVGVAHVHRRAVAARPVARPGPVEHFEPPARYELVEVERFDDEADVIEPP